MEDRDKKDLQMQPWNWERKYLQKLTPQEKKLSLRAPGSEHVAPFMNYCLGNNLKQAYSHFKKHNQVILTYHMHYGEKATNTLISEFSRQLGDRYSLSLESALEKEKEKRKKSIETFKKQVKAVIESTERMNRIPHHIWDLTFD